MRPSKYCKKCGMTHSWTNSKYNRKGWKCECGNYNPAWKFWSHLLVAIKGTYEFCWDCGALVHGKKIKKGTGCGTYGYKCKKCNYEWTIYYEVML